MYKNYGFQAWRSDIHFYKMQGQTTISFYGVSWKQYQIEKLLVCHLNTLKIPHTHHTHTPYTHIYIDAHSLANIYTHMRTNTHRHTSVPLKMEEEAMKNNRHFVKAFKQKLETGYRLCFHSDEGMDVLVHSKIFLCFLCVCVPVQRILV